MKMNFKCKVTGGLLVILAGVLGFPGAVFAESESDYQSPNEVIERAFFKNSPNYYRNQGLNRDIDFILGPGTLFRNSFPENEIARDADLVNVVFRDTLNQQTINDPYIRTPDLPNPYGSSLLMSPRMNTERLRTGTEFRFDTVQPPQIQPQRY